MQDLTGKTYGNLTVISKGETYISPKGINKIKWICKCDCGNTTEVVTDNLISGNTTSCGCKHKYRNDWIGQVFTNLTVIKEITQPKQRRRMLCQCACGKQKEVYLSHLTTGKITSCGCTRKQAKYEDLTGKTFNYLKVISENFEKQRPKTHFWNCECSLCGGMTVVTSGKLKAGLTKSCGCSKSFGEQQIISLLTDANIEYKREYTFKDLVSEAGQHLRFDFAVFYNNKLSHLIEFQGEQHYINVFKRSDEDFANDLARDQQKRDYCKQHNIPLIEIKYDEEITLAKLLVYRTRGLEDENFLQYKSPAMFIANTTCDFKCDRENGTCLCINQGLIKEPTRVFTIDALIKRYFNNPITSAIVFGGLEQLDEFNQLRNFIICFRQVSMDPVVIYTGYTESELTLEQVKTFIDYPGIIVKFGRFIPGHQPHFDSVLGIKLASDNQYGKDFGYES